jgi:hypothetical protein
MQAGSPTVMRSIYLLKFFPLIGQIVKGENSRHGADRNAGATINAFHRIDEKLLRFAEFRLIFARVNAIDRAGIHTRGVLDPNARFSNYI